MIDNFFELSGSTTIQNKDLLEQLATNLCFAFDLEFTEQQILRAVKRAPSWQACRLTGRDRSAKERDRVQF